MFTTARPHPALRDYVDDYVGYREQLDPTLIHHGLPSPRLTVIIAFDRPLECGWVDRPEGAGTFWTLASGLHTRPALIRPHGFQHGIQLSFTPAGARALLGLPAAALAGELVEHPELPHGLTDQGHAQLNDAEDWPTRFRILDRHLLGLLDSSPAAARPEVAHVWRSLATTGGQGSVDALAAAVGWSRRHLSATFGAEYGVSPKQAARIFRFDHARRLIDAGAALAVVAADTGYADQQHLSREWRALADRTPTEHLHSAYS